MTLIPTHTKPIPVVITMTTQTLVEITLEEPETKRQRTLRESRERDTVLLNYKQSAPWKPSRHRVGQRQRQLRLLRFVK